MLRILGKSESINVRKVLWLCAEMGLAYEQEQWGQGFQSTQAPDFKLLNPNAMVPVICDGDFVLWESNAICRYLASHCGRTDLLPTEARARARIEQWMDWQVAELNTAWRYAFMALVRRSPAHADPTAIEQSIRGWNRHMSILEDQLTATGAYVAGSTFTLADIVIGLSTHRWLKSPIDRPDLPAVNAYYERLSALPPFLLHARDGMP
jgi:glutathione S-transferase